MNLPFFRPQEVHAKALILVGYRLYPYTRVELHPRLTLLSGGNGVGKTTLLDALQTVILADQRYLHLNVASGQNDRDLGGQLQNRIGWALVHIGGHSKIQAVGVLLARRAAAEYVDLKPFALLGIPPEENLFLNRDKGEVASDLRALNQSIKRFSSGARVKEFGSINDYHRFLYEEGLLPLDLSRGGRRQFSLLWRQATQPHLGELNNFLQQTLCHEPEKRLTFQDVEKLMQERLHTERQLNQLWQLKELSGELQGKARDLDYHRRRYLSVQLGLSQRREESLLKDIEEGEKRFQQLDERIAALNQELDGVRVRLDALGKERDRYLREQGEWSRKYKHYQEYTENREIREEIQKELAAAAEGILPLEEKIREVREKAQKIRGEMLLLSNELARLKSGEENLEGQVRKWLEFKKDLERAGILLQREIRSLSDLESAWAEINEARRKVQEVKPLRQLLGQWQSRARAHNVARELAGKMIDLWPDFFNGRTPDRALLDRALTELRNLEKDVAVQRQELSASKGPLEALIDELSRGRMPLPASAGELVEKGLACPFARHFDHLGLDEARHCQETMGPLARAIEPVSLLPAGSPQKQKPMEEKRAETEETKPSLAGLACGKEPFWLILSPDVWKDFRVLERTEQGTIAGLGGIAWYTPHGPVWIGAEARREQIQRAQESILEVEGKIKQLAFQEDLISRRRRAIQDFLPKLDALADVEAPLRAEELNQTLAQLEKTAPGVEKLYPILQRIFQRSELFHFVHAPEEMEKLKKQLQEIHARYRQMDDEVKGFNNEDAKCSRGLASLKGRLQALTRDLDRAQTICSRLEEEEPREVLEGRVDFGRAEELAKRIKELDEERIRAQNELFLGERKNGELRNRYRTQSEALVKARRDLDYARKDHQRALELWARYYPEEEAVYIFGARPDERERHKAVWDNLVQVLRSRIAEVSRKYEFHLPQEDQPDRLIPQLLQLLLPSGVALDQLEAQYGRLQHELQQIEYKIKSRVEEVRSNVEMEIRYLRTQLVKVNRILSSLRFGQIKKISLELEELPAYHALQKLESLLRLISRGESITLKEFVDKLRAFIKKESNTTLTEEQIADYRSYIRIRRIVLDANDRARESGLSSGEALGVNLALCLAILFFMGREQGNHSERGMLLLALDEAERLDARALETIRSLLDEVRCQLTVAMPRPVDIPDSICHLLTPLSEGVTHVHLYRKEDGAGDTLAGP